MGLPDAPQSDSGSSIFALAGCDAPSCSKGVLCCQLLAWLRQQQE